MPLKQKSPIFLYYLLHVVGGNLRYTFFYVIKLDAFSGTIGGNLSATVRINGINKWTEPTKNKSLHCYKRDNIL